MTWDGIPEHWGKGHYRDIPWSRYVLLARERQQRDLKRWLDRDPAFPYYFDTEAADFAVWFFSQLRHTEGRAAGEPFILSDWQEWDLIRPLFGWKHNEGFRRFRMAYIEVARGNGKSTLMAGLGNLLTVGDREQGGQVYAAATKERQARIIWKAARDAILASPTLRDEVVAFKSSLYNPELSSVFMPLGQDSRTEDGLSVHGGLVDEYHAHKTEEMLEVLKSATVKRWQPLITIITTAGLEETCPCKDESDRGKRLLEGGFEKDDLLVFIATVDDPEKWEEETEWIKANPNYGISVFPHIFKSEAEEAQQKATKRIFFKTKNLNIWTSGETKWIPLSRWKECDGEIDWEMFRGRRCFAGFDLGVNRDLSCLTLAFMGDEKKGEIDPETGLPVQPDVHLLMKSWIPEKGMMERYRNDGVSYPTWAEQGWITPTPGETTRYDIILRDILELSEKFEIAEIAGDQAHAHDFMLKLADNGFEVAKHPQTMLAMAYPCRSFEELIYAKRLKHGNNPVLRWMVGNAVVAVDGNNNMKVMKNRSSDRVDGVVSTVMAIGRLLIAPEPVNFVYNTRGMVG